VKWSDSERIQVRKTDHWKASRLDFSDVLTPIVPARGRVCKLQDKITGRQIDRQQVDRAVPARADQQAPVRKHAHVRNVDRTIGAMLAGGSRAARQGRLRKATIKLNSGLGRSKAFGAFATGMELTWRARDDYVARPSRRAQPCVRRRASPPSESEHILGNTALYGATSARRS